MNDKFKRVAVYYQNRAAYEHEKGKTFQEPWLRALWQEYAAKSAEYARKYLSMV